MDNNVFMELIEELTLYLYRKHYDEPNKDMARRQVMYFLWCYCKDAETLKETKDILERNRRKND